MANQETISTQVKAAAAVTVASDSLVISLLQSRVESCGWLITSLCLDLPLKSSLSHLLT